MESAHPRLLDADQLSEATDYDKGEWLKADVALGRLARVMRSAPAAKALLLDALETGSLSACAALIREEWDIGPIRPEGARDSRYFLGTADTQTFGMITIDKRLFTRKPKGARRWINWKKSHFAWIAPPGRLFLNKKTQERGRVVSRRIVMFGVVFGLRQYTAIIDSQRTSYKRSHSARAAGLGKSHYSKLQWELVRLKPFYDQAKAGVLETDTFNIDHHGERKRFAFKLMVHCGEDISNKSRLRTYLRQVDELRRVNRINRKDPEQGEQPN